MIHVIATVSLKPGCRDKYLEILKGNVDNVKGEAGCLVYAPTIDMETDIEIQEKAGDEAVTSGEIGAKPEPGEESIPRQRIVEHQVP